MSVQTTFISSTLQLLQYPLSRDNALHSLARSCARLSARRRRRCPAGDRYVPSLQNDRKRRNSSVLLAVVGDGANDLAIRQNLGGVVGGVVGGTSVGGATGAASGVASGIAGPSGALGSATGTIGGAIPGVASGDGTGSAVGGLNGGGALGAATGTLNGAVPGVGSGTVSGTIAGGVVP